MYRQQKSLQKEIEELTQNVETFNLNKLKHLSIKNESFIANKKVLQRNEQKLVTKIKENVEHMENLEEINTSDISVSIKQINKRKIASYRYKIARYMDELEYIRIKINRVDRDMIRNEKYLENLIPGKFVINGIELDEEDEEINL